MSIPAIVRDVDDREAAELALQVPRSHCFTFAGRAHPLTDLPLPLVGSVIRSWLQLRA